MKGPGDSPARRQFLQSAGVAAVVAALPAALPTASPAAGLPATQVVRTHCGSRARRAR